MKTSKKQQQLKQHVHDSNGKWENLSFIFSIFATVKTQLQKGRKKRKKKVITGAILLFTILQGLIHHHSGSLSHAVNANVTRKKLFIFLSCSFAAHTLWRMCSKCVSRWEIVEVFHVPDQIDSSRLMQLSIINVVWFHPSCFSTFSHLQKKVYFFFSVSSTRWCTDVYTSNCKYGVKLVSM